MKSLLAISTFLVATSGFAAGTTSTNGQWSMHQNIANNESDQQCTFTQKETTITGTCKSADGKDLPVTGTVDGKKVTWKYDMDFNGTTLTLNLFRNSR